MSYHDDKEKLKASSVKKLKDKMPMKKKKKKKKPAPDEIAVPPTEITGGY